MDTNIYCEDCDKKITFNIYRYSNNLFKRGLCLDCQKKERLGVMPEKLAKFINEQVDKYGHYSK